MDIPHSSISLLSAIVDTRIGNLLSPILISCYFNIRPHVVTSSPCSRVQTREDQFNYTKAIITIYSGKHYGHVLMCSCCMFLSSIMIHGTMHCYVQCNGVDNECQIHNMYCHWQFQMYPCMQHYSLFMHLCVTSCEVNGEHSWGNYVIVLWSVDMWKYSHMMWCCVMDMY